MSYEGSGIWKAILRSYIVEHILLPALTVPLMTRFYNIDTIWTSTYAPIASTPAEQVFMFNITDNKTSIESSRAEASNGGQRNGWKNNSAGGVLIAYKNDEEWVIEVVLGVCGCLRWKLNSPSPSERFLNIAQPSLTSFHQSHLEATALYWRQAEKYR